ncbi:MAG: hypothetical protein AAF657_21465 [Acidobacteriota bacterium]
MKRKVLSCLAASLTVAAVFGLSALYPAPDVTAEPYCSQMSCSNAVMKTIGPRTFSDLNDCDWAEMDAFGLLQFEAQIDCGNLGFCTEPQFLITKPCTATSPPYTVDMQVRYSCARCGSGFQQAE